MQDLVASHKRILTFGNSSGLTKKIYQGMSVKDTANLLFEQNCSIPPVHELFSLLVPFVGEKLEEKNKNRNHNIWQS